MALIGHSQCPCCDRQTLFRIGVVHALGLRQRRAGHRVTGLLRYYCLIEVLLLRKEYLCRKAAL